MSIITKRGKWIILIILIALILSSAYILKSGSEKFVILDVKKLSSLSYPGLKLAAEATEECNKLEAEYKNKCYHGVAWALGYYYSDSTCKNLKVDFKSSCYQGYGRSVGEKYSPDIKIIQDECSKTEFYESCLIDALVGIGKESSRHIETEQCQEFKQEAASQTCYDGLGRQLATDNKEQDLCRTVKNEEACLIGFADLTYRKGSIDKALQICNQLNEKNTKTCYSRIGWNSLYYPHKTIQELFSNCEQYLYSEDCKKGIAVVVPYKFFEENQQKNEETASVITPVMFEVYKPIKRIITKSSLTIKQQIIPHFLNYRLVYLQIVLSSLGVIIIIRVLKNRKFQELIKRTYKKTGAGTQRICHISTKELLIIYKESKLIIRDILSIDKTTITSFFKELKIEIRSKEGKKNL